MLRSVSRLVGVIACVGGLALQLPAGSAGAVTCSVTGSLRVTNPAALVPSPFESGPVEYGRKQGAEPPTRGVSTLDALG